MGKGSEADFYSLSNRLYRNNHLCKEPRQMHLSAALCEDLMYGKNHLFISNQMLYFESISPR